MTEPKLKIDKEAGNLSETAKAHLMDIFVSKEYGRQTDIRNKYIEKGLAVEEDGFTLYSRVKKQFYKKNETRLTNDFIQGEPDIIHEDTVIDTKNSWDMFTFFRTFGKPINDIYYWQITGYKWLTGCSNGILAYCLVNTPAPLIEKEKKYLWYDLGQPLDDDENWIDAQRVLERAMIYDDLPLKNRVLEYIIESEEADIDLIKAKVIKGREYLAYLQSKLCPSV